MSSRTAPSSWTIALGRARPVREAARSFARLANFSAARTDPALVVDEQVPHLAARERLVVRNLARLGPAQRPRQLSLAVAAYVGDVRRSRGVLEMIEGVLGAESW